MRREGGEEEESRGEERRGEESRGEEKRGKVHFRPVVARSNHDHCAAACCSLARKTGCRGLGVKEGGIEG